MLSHGTAHTTPHLPSFRLEYPLQTPNKPSTVSLMTNQYLVTRNNPPPRFRWDYLPQIQKNSTGFYEIQHSFQFLFISVYSISIHSNLLQTHTQKSQDQHRWNSMLISIHCPYAHVWLWKCKMYYLWLLYKLDMSCQTLTWSITAYSST